MNGAWNAPNGCAVCLTFDVDGEYAWSRDAQILERRMGGRVLLALGLRRILGASLVTESQGEFGIQVGLNRILDLLHKYSIPATFFVPGAIAERYPDSIRRIAERNHEIAHHGYLHESPLYFERRPREERRHLELGASALERVTGRRPVGYRAPGFDLTPQTVRLLEETHFLYDSTLMGQERPHVLSLRGEETSLVEIPVDWSLDDFPYFAFWKPPISASGLGDPSRVLEIWKRELDGYRDVGGCFTLTLHPSIIGRHHRIWILEELIRHAQGRGGVWWARCLDVAMHLRSGARIRLAGAAGT